MNVSFIPAKEVPAASSPTADDRTAIEIGVERSVSMARCFTASTTAARNELVMPVWRMSVLASVDAARSESYSAGWERSTQRSSWLRMPAVPMASRNAPAVTTNPGGTGNLARVSSPRFAAFPPTSSASESESSSIQRMVVSVIRELPGVGVAVQKPCRRHEGFAIAHER